MPEEKPKRKVRDLAGVAAIITAVGGVIGLYFQTQAHQNETSMVQDSVLVLIQYRIDQLEGEVSSLRDLMTEVKIQLGDRRGSRRVRTLAGEAAEAPRMAAAEVSGETTVTVFVDAESAPETPSEAKVAELIGRIKKKESVRLQDIQATVQAAGRSLQREDLQ